LDPVERLFCYAVSPSAAETTSAREWSEPGGRDIDYKTRGARVREREAIESKPSELSMLPPPSAPHVSSSVEPQAELGVVAFEKFLVAQ
jgi:hypothetical protein